MCLLSQCLGDFGVVGPGDHTLRVTRVSYAQLLASTSNPEALSHRRSLNRVRLVEGLGT